MLINLLFIFAPNFNLCAVKIFRKISVIMTQSGLYHFQKWLTRWQKDSLFFVKCQKKVNQKPGPIRFF